VRLDDGKEEVITAVPSGREKAALPISQRTIVVTVRNVRQEAVTAVQLRVRPQPYVIDQTFRFHQSENEFLKTTIRLQATHWTSTDLFVSPGNSIGGSLLPTHWGPPPPPLPLSSLAPQPVWISCSDPDVVAGVHERRQPTDPTEVSLKYKCQASPCVGRFLVLVYNDVWKHVLRETWEVLVHSLERIDLHALVGESTHAKISIRGSERGASGLVQCFSSAPSELRLTPEAPFALSSGSVNEIGVRLRPSTPGRQRYVVHAVELQSRKLVASWLINATQRLPAITKAFSLTVPLTLGANRKVSLTNPYTYDSRFLPHRSAAAPCLQRGRDRHPCG